MKAEHERYIRTRFAAATVHDDPFPYLEIDGILPPDLYETMNAAAPGPVYCAALIALSRLKSSTPMPVHFALRKNNFSSPGLLRFEKSWERFADVITLVDELILATFRPRIARYLSVLRHRGLIRAETSIDLGQAIFCHRTRGWEIGPHLHNISQLVQSMIYFPLPGSKPEQGTLFYRFRDRGRHMAASDLQHTIMIPMSAIEEAVSITYEPNKLVSWLNTPLSVHASSNITSPNRRYTFTAISAAAEFNLDNRYIAPADFSDDAPP